MNSEGAEQAENTTGLQRAFPASLADDAAAVLRVIPTAQHPPTADLVGPIFVAGEQLRIPHRIYSEVPARLQLASLNADRQIMLACLYTRHHDGFIRQRFTVPLIEAAKPWVVPYLLQLVGEYVCENQELILAQLPRRHRDMFLRFATENQPFLVLTCHRVISYWHVHYRPRFPRFTDYPGYRIMAELKLWRDEIAPHLLSGRSWS